MRVKISTAGSDEANQRNESLERLLRLALGRYTPFLRQIKLDLDDTARSGVGSGCRVRLRARIDQRPDVEIEEVQPHLDLAVDRAIHRADSVLRQLALQAARRA